MKSLIKDWKHKNNATNNTLNIKPIFIDNVNIEDELFFWYLVADQLGTKKSDNITVLFVEIIGKIEQLLNDSNCKIVFIIDEPYLWTFFKDEFETRLNKLKKIMRERIKFITLIDPFNTFEPLSYKRFKTSLHAKQLYWSLFDYQETIYQVKRNRFLMNLDIKRIDIKSFAKTIYELAKGVAGLTKRLSLLEPSDLDKDIKTILQIDGVYKATVKTLKGINRYYFQQLKHTKPNKYLFKLGLINQKGNINGALLRYICKNYDYGDIHRDTISSLDNLSDTESSVYELLQRKNGTVVTREEIAKEMWGKKYADKYSDWAIDALIKRVREKLPESNIETKRGKGFFLG
jgi:hypothetical protein